LLTISFLPSFPVKAGLTPGGPEGYISDSRGVLGSVGPSAANLPHQLYACKGATSCVSWADQGTANNQPDESNLPKTSNTGLQQHITKLQQLARFQSLLQALLGVVSACSKYFELILQPLKF